MHILQLIKGKNKMKKMIFNVLFVLAIIFYSLLILSVIIGSVIYRFSNPELTETQIILWGVQNYWWAYILILLPFLVCVLIKNV